MIFGIMNLTKAIVGILFVLTPTLASGPDCKNSGSRKRRLRVFKRRSARGN